MEHVFERQTRLASPLPDVFAFFSDAKLAACWKLAIDTMTIPMEWGEDDDAEESEALE